MIFHYFFNDSISYLSILLKHTNFAFGLSVLNNNLKWSNKSLQL